MSLAITSIQRNRAPWIMEWLAFHMMVGFDRFYLYAHRCDDGTAELLQRLSRHYPIVVHVLDVPERAQLLAYQHAWNSYGSQVDWMAFVDGDKFLFPTAAKTMQEALRPYGAQELSALAVYWVCYGGSGHLDDPGGLVLEQFTRHSGPDFIPNRHVKSIVRGSTEPMQVGNPHLFHLPKGTFDEGMRPVNRGCMTDIEPTYDVFRINHYVVQHYEFFKRTKQSIGNADGDPNYRRTDDFYDQHDRNEFDDGVRWRFLLGLKLKLRELHAALQAP